MICVISSMLCSNLIHIREYVQKLFSMELLISDFQLHCTLRYLFMFFGLALVWVVENHDKRAIKNCEEKNQRKYIWSFLFFFYFFSFFFNQRSQRGKVSPEFLQCQPISLCHCTEGRKMSERKGSKPWPGSSRCISRVSLNLHPGCQATLAQNALSTLFQFLFSPDVTELSVSS